MAILGVVIGHISAESALCKNYLIGLFNQLIRLPFGFHFLSGMG